MRELVRTFAEQHGPGSEHHSMPAPDDRALYVTSDRPGGFGGDDPLRHDPWPGLPLGPLIDLWSAYFSDLR